MFLKIDYIQKLFSTKKKHDVVRGCEEKNEMINGWMLSPTRTRAFLI